jgi:hypothetical protein
MIVPCGKTPNGSTLLTILRARKTRKRKGQILVIMLLIMSFSMLVGIAISTRVVTTLRQTSYSTQSAKAISLAEAGVEDGLKKVKDAGTTSYSSGNVPLGEGTFNYTITPIGPQPLVNEFSPISRDQTIQFNLTGYPPYPTKIEIYWVDTGNDSELSDPAAMELTFLYAMAGYKTQKYVCDPSFGRSQINKFNYISVSPSPSIDGKKYLYKLSLVPPSGVILLRIRALYNTVANSFAVRGSGGIVYLPQQGVRITSEGTVEEVRRKVEVIRSSDVLPEIFDYVLFSGSDTAAVAK